MKRLFLILSAALVLAGCSTTHVCDIGGHAMIDITNTGWYLFNFIPLASGRPAHPNAFGCSLFSDTVSIENNQKLLDYATRSYLHGTADVGDYGYANVVSYTTDENVLFILLKRHACHTSAELVPKTPETK